VRIVGEMDDNMMLHIFNEKQLEHKWKNNTIAKWKVPFIDKL
jgi:hypothetical protein